MPKVYHALNALRASLLDARRRVLRLGAAAQQPAGKYDPPTYEHTSADIADARRSEAPRRDLRARRNATEPLPFLFERTPYGVGGIRRRDRRRAYKDLAEDGYIFVFQDIRGRYKSEGTFVMQRPPKPVDAPAQAIDETTDTNDSIDWMLAERPEQQRARGDARRQLRRLDRRDGHARRA